MSVENLCDWCLHRQKSLNCVEEFMKQNPNEKGFVCDPAPKAECKWHTGYGHSSNYQKTRCRDFAEKEK